MHPALRTGKRAGLPGNSKMCDRLTVASLFQHVLESTKLICLMYKKAETPTGANSRDGCAQCNRWLLTHR